MRWEDEMRKVKASMLGFLIRVHFNAYVYTLYLLLPLSRLLAFLPPYCPISPFNSFRKALVSWSQSMTSSLVKSILSPTSLLLG